MKVKLFVDFDGTLIDSKPRCFKLFKELLPDYKYSLDHYINLKSKGISNEDIVRSYCKISERQLPLFIKTWHKEIESPERLRLDSLQPGVLSWLETTHQIPDVSLYLCTARQSAKNTIDQLVNLNINSYFEDILITEKKFKKVDLIRKITDSKAVNYSDWIIGDSPDDILNGKQGNLNTCAVLTGFRDEKTLLKYEPDLIISSITEFPIVRLTEGFTGNSHLIV